jgi:hypothetical protein
MIYQHLNISETETRYRGAAITTVVFKEPSYLFGFRGLGLNIKLPIGVGCGIYSIEYRGVVRGLWKPILYFTIRYSKYSKWYNKIRFEYETEFVCDEIYEIFDEIN